MNPLFTFAIVNWNTRERLRECLTSILEQAEGFQVQILVADNASADGSAEMVESCFPQVELVRNHDNLGFAAGHEALFQRSRGLYHVLVNSDVRFLPGCLARWNQVMVADARIGILGCRIVGPDGHLQRSCRRFPSLLSQLLEASGIGRLAPRSRLLNGYKMGEFDHQSSREVDQVMGSLFLIRRELIDRIGILDTAFFMYYEEVDYCRRCRDAGYITYYDAESQVWHEGGGSSRMVRIATMQRTFRSMRHYFAKHHGAWTYWPLLAIVSLDTVTHSLFALVTGRQPWLTFKAYALASWDLMRRRSARA